ncbi:MAG: PAS domain S-box protein [Cyclobacteriaceae bacterium]|nr:PAS domain S-box protein [Cyclobacteriaceae bacterium]
MDFSSEKKTLDCEHLLGVLQRYHEKINGYSIYRLVLETFKFIKEEFEFSYSSIVLHDEEYKNVMLYERNGTIVELHEKQFVPSQNEILTLISKEKREFYRENLDKWPSMYQFDDQPNAVNIKSDYFIPLCLQNRCIGIIRVGSDVPNGITLQDRKLIHLLVPSLTIALENARMKQLLDIQDKKYNSLFNFSNDHIYTLDKDWVIYEMNHDVWGRNKSDLIGRSILDIQIYGDEALSLEHYLEEMYANAKSVYYESEIMLKGRTSFFSTVISPMINQQVVEGATVIVKNITEQKQNELKYKQSEAAYRSLLENHTEVVTRVKPDSTCLYANEASAKMMGYTVGEMVGKKMTDLTHGDKSLIKQQYELIVREKRPVTIVSEMTPGKWHKWIDTPIFNEKGEVVEIQTTGMDISELMIEKKLREESEKKYRLLAENATDVICLIDGLGNYQYISPTIVGLSGYTTEELENKPLSIIYPEDRIKLIDFLNKLIRSRADDYLEIRILTKGGVEKWIGTSVACLKGVEGTIENFVSVIRDITAQKVAEEELVESKNFNRQLFETSRIGLKLKNMNGQLIDVNQSFADIIGYTVEELKGMSVKEFIPDRQLFMVEDELSFIEKDGEFGPWEREYIHKKGHIVYVKVQGTKISRNGKNYIWSSVENISEQKEAEQRLEKANNQLIVSEKMASLGVLTAGIAHEINNPVNYVFAGINSLEENLREVKNLLSAYFELNEENAASKITEINQMREEMQFDRLLSFVTRTTTNIRKGAERTSEIVRGLRTFSRLDNAKLILADIEESLDNTLLLLHNQYNGRIEIVRKFGHIPQIECYPGELNQVFVNIVSNAIQAISEKGVITIGTHCVDKLGKTYAHIYIRDSGMGMPENIRAKIFEPFYTTKEVGKGTGLGLSITHGIIEKHNGIIEVESKVGKGTTFHIYLPI